MAQAPYDEEFKSADEFPSAEELYKDAIAKTEAERASMTNYEKQLMAKSGTAPAAPAQDFNPQYQKVLGQEEQSVQDIKAANEQAQAHAAAAAAAKAPYIKGAQDEIQKQLDNPITPPTPPQFGPVPNQGQYIDQTAAKAMFAVASMMAALGMAGGRGRGMLAMAGMTGALAGFNEGNYEKYKEGMDQYKTQIEEQIAAYNMQMKDYQARMDQEGLTLERRTQLLELETLKWNDTLGQDILKRDGAVGLMKYYDEMGKTVSEMAKAAQQDFLHSHQEKMAKIQEDIANVHLKTAEINQDKAKAQQAKTKQGTARQSQLNQYITRLQKSRDQWQKYRDSSSWYQWDRKAKADKEITGIDDKIRKAEDEMGRIQMGLAVSSGGSSDDDIVVGEPIGK